MKFVNFFNLSEDILAIVIPIVILTFILLMYVVIYLFESDPDVIRSRIFLRYNDFRKSFVILVIFALVLILHTSLIFIEHDAPIIFNLTPHDMQILFGVALAVIMCVFSYFIYKSIK